MINLLLQELKNYKDIVSLIKKSSNDSELIAFFHVKTIRRVLAGMISPSRFNKFLMKLLGKMVSK